MSTQSHLIVLTLSVATLLLQSALCLPSSSDQTRDQSHDQDGLLFDVEESLQNSQPDKSSHDGQALEGLLRKVLQARTWDREEGRTGLFDRVLTGALLRAGKANQVPAGWGNNLDKRGGALEEFVTFKHKKDLAQDDLFRTLKRSGVCCSMDMYCFYCGR